MTVWTDGDVPSVTDYLALRRQANLYRFSKNAARTSLARSVFSVTARQGDTLVAMARITGDGALFNQVNDVVVHPTCQGQGLGREAMTRLLAWASIHLPSGGHLSLIATERGAPLYRRSGFAEARGMELFIE